MPRAFGTDVPVLYHSSVIILLLELILTAALSQSAIVDRIAATVDDEAITESDVRKAIATSPLRPAPDESPEAFRARVLDALIDQRLSYADALRFGPAAPDAAAVEDALAKLKARLKSEGKDPEKEFAAAGLTPEEVRASVERQLLIQRHLQERFRPMAFADDARAREEYEKSYVPELRAANRAPEPFEKVEEEMRRRAQQRTFEEEVEKWMKDLREKARIVVYKAPASIPPRTPTPIKSSPKFNVQLSRLSAHPAIEL
jgi:parvulin-like peptidyl-prolyl isomerase